MALVVTVDTREESSSLLCATTGVELDWSPVADHIAMTKKVPLRLQVTVDVVHGTLTQTLRKADPISGMTT